MTSLNSFCHRDVCMRWAITTLISTNNLRKVILLIEWFACPHETGHITAILFTGIIVSGYHFLHTKLSAIFFQFEISTNFEKSVTSYLHWGIIILFVYFVILCVSCTVACMFVTCLIYWEKCGFISETCENQTASKIHSIVLVLYNWLIGHRGLASSCWMSSVT